MASYHCTVKVGSRGMGGKHADYIQRTGAYKNYRDGEELAHKEFLNFPSWAEHDPSEFFRQADLHERANGSAYREIEVAIPRELTPEQRIEFIREFVRQEIGADHPCVWAIHQPKSALTETEQPHAHIMFSERKLDGIERNPEQFFKRVAAAYKHRTTKKMVQPDAAAKAKGGCPKADKFAGSPTERREKLVALRERFAGLQNEYLAKHGHADRVTHKSLEDQGIDRLPEKHLGPVGARVEENIAAILRNRDANQKLAAAEYEVSQIDLSSSINHQEKKHVRASRDKTRHHQPVADHTQMRDVFGIDNVHDLGIPQDVLQPDAPRDLRSSQAAADSARLHQLASARAAVEALTKAQAVIAEIARAAQERAQAIAGAERKAAWVARGARRRSGTPNRIIRLDQSIQAGRIEYRWTGSGPSAGKIAVIQKGNQLSAAGRYSQPKAKAMAQIAQENGWRSVTITGDATFKAMALPELLARGIAVNNPELQPQVQVWQVKAQAGAEQDLQAKARADAERLSAQFTAEAAKRQAEHERQQGKDQAEREQRQTERQEKRDQHRAKRDAERLLDEAIAQIKQHAAAKELAGQPALSDAAAVAPSVQSKQSAPLAQAVEAPAVAPAPTRLDAKDMALFRGAAQAIAAGDMKVLAGQLRKIDQAERKLIEAMTLAGSGVKPFDENGTSRQLSVRDANQRREAINAKARTRGEKNIPFVAGHSTLISDTYDYQQEQAVRELSLHTRSSRPEGFFNRKAGREWDATKVELETTRAAWAGAVASRDRAEQEATTADNATFQYRLDAIRNEHATKAAAAIAKCAPIKERLQDFTAERKRIERATETLSQEMQKELGREHGRGHGISR